jgi:hypothetical protein
MRVSNISPWALHAKTTLEISLKIETHDQQTANTLDTTEPA